MLYICQLIKAASSIKILHGKWLKRVANSNGYKILIGFKCTAWRLTSDCLIHNTICVAIEAGKQRSKYEKSTIWWPL